MSRLLAVLATLLVGVFALLHPSLALTTQAVFTATHTYDSHYDAAMSMHTTTERGPPSTCARHTSYPFGERWSHGASAHPDDTTPTGTTTYITHGDFTQGLQTTGTNREPCPPLVGGPSSLAPAGVAAKTVDELAEVGFRSDTSHIFRNATGHLAQDTADNRALIKSALDPANLRDTITLKDGTTLQKYFRDLPDGTQAWAEVRNGEITNGGLNVIPR